MTDSHPLLQRLNLALKQILALDYKTPVTESYEGVLQLCEVLEELLSTDLKSVALFRSTNAWDYLENLADCMPAESFLKQIRSVVRTGQGRVRAFIRYALCESSFPEYLSALAWNKNLTTSYYHDRALLRDEELVSILLLLFVALKPYKFDLPVTKELDRDDYWAFIKPYVPPALKEPQERRLHSVVSASAPSVVHLGPSDRQSAPDTPGTPESEPDLDATTDGEGQAGVGGAGKRKTRKKKAKVATIGGTAEETELKDQMELAMQLKKTKSQVLTYEIDLETERQRRQMLQDRINLLEKELNQHNQTIASLHEELVIWKEATKTSGVTRSSSLKPPLSTADRICNGGTGDLSTKNNSDEDCVARLQPALDQIDEYFRTGNFPTQQPTADATTSSSSHDDRTTSHDDAEEHQTTLRRLNQMTADLHDLTSFDSLQSNLENFAQSLRALGQK